ncbi:MAG TPA: winged helix-turn-helix domain-containing protein [Candidatus Dormibacteraeota bacterium]|nr:winged helix-turn-helix domain-containing protein [Candidatus Dormibacteraeota bacterium]
MIDERVTYDIRVSMPHEMLQSMFYMLKPRARVAELLVGSEWFDHARYDSSPELLSLIARCKEAMPSSDSCWDAMLGTGILDQPLSCPEYLDMLDELPLGENKIFAEALRGWYEEVFRQREPQLRPILEVDAERKREMARHLSLHDLIEKATNGIDQNLDPPIEHVLLVPSYLGRPWVNHDRYGTTELIQYPTAEEDPLVQVTLVARALCDVHRVQALHVLSTGRRTLQELANQIGVTKSTMYHHIALLRAAGLVRVHSPSKLYSVRPEALTRVRSALESLITPDSRRGGIQ